MARTKGATNKKNSNATVVKVNNGEVKEIKPRGRQKGQVIEREASIVIDLDSNYRIKWDKLNKQLQVKMEKVNNESQPDEDVEDGFKTLGYFQSWQGLGKRYIDELTRKNVLRKSKDGITDINSLIDVVNRIENKVVKLFGQLEVDEERIKVQ